MKDLVLPVCFSILCFSTPCLSQVDDRTKVYASSGKWFSAAVYSDATTATCHLITGDAREAAPNTLYLSFAIGMEGAEAARAFEEAKVELNSSLREAQRNLYLDSASNDNNDENSAQLDSNDYVEYDQILGGTGTIQFNTDKDLAFIRSIISEAAGDEGQVSAAIVAAVSGESNVVTLTFDNGIEYRLRGFLFKTTVAAGDSFFRSVNFDLPIEDADLIKEIKSGERMSLSVDGENQGLLSLQGSSAAVEGFYECLRDHDLLEIRSP